MQFSAIVPLLLAGLAAVNAATPAGNPNAIPTLERRATPVKRVPRPQGTGPVPVDPRPRPRPTSNPRPGRPNQTPDVRYPTLGNCSGLTSIGCDADPLCKWDLQYDVSCVLTKART